MISFRYHVVSLVAVLLALAAGVALGGGPLSDLGRQPTATAKPASDAGAIDRERAFADDLATAGATRWYADGLAGASVLIVTFPGASDSTRQAVAAQVSAAGGAVTGTYAVQPTLVDPGEKTLVDTLGSQLMTQLPDAGISPSASTYQRVGELIGAALTSTNAKGNKALNEQSTSIIQSLGSADLLKPTTEATGRATYVIGLLGPSGPADADPIYAGLLSGLAPHAVGVVLAAPDAGGRLSRLRRDPVAEQVATVDGVDRPTGQVTAVLALSQWPTSRGGAFGASGADGAVGLG